MKYLGGVHHLGGGWSVSTLQSTRAPRPAARRAMDDSRGTKRKNVEEGDVMADAALTTLKALLPRIHQMQPPSAASKSGKGAAMRSIVIRKIEQWLENQTNAQMQKKFPPKIAEVGRLQAGLEFSIRVLGRPHVIQAIYEYLAADTDDD